MKWSQMDRYGLVVENLMKVKNKPCGDMTPHMSKLYGLSGNYMDPPHFASMDIFGTHEFLKKVSFNFF